MAAVQKHWDRNKKIFKIRSLLFVLNNDAFTLCVCVCMWNVLCYVLMLFVSSFDLLILFFLFRGGRKDPFGDSQLGALLVAAWLPLQKVLQELGQSSWSA